MAKVAESLTFFANDVFSKYIMEASTVSSQPYTTQNNTTQSVNIIIIEQIFFKKVREKKSINK